MIRENLVGQVFTFEKHEDVAPLAWSSSRERFIGRKFEVLMIHKEKPEFCYIRMLEDESCNEMYYPTEVVVKQLSPNYLSDLYKRILELTKEVCENKN